MLTFELINLNVVLPYLSFQLEGVESNFRDLEESMDKVARHYKRVNSVFEP